MRMPLLSEVIGGISYLTSGKYISYQLINTTSIPHLWVYIYCRTQTIPVDCARKIFIRLPLVDHFVLALKFFKLFVALINKNKIKWNGRANLFWLSLCLNCKRRVNQTSCLKLNITVEYFYMHLQHGQDH